METERLTRVESECASRELLARFEAGTLGGDEFDHAAHVRAAWALLRQEPLLGALTRFTSGIRRLAARLGAPGKFHATITSAYLCLIHERLSQDAAREMIWEEFAQRNPDLLAPRLAAIRHYYSEETLWSPEARHHFVPPDENRRASNGGAVRSGAIPTPA